MLSMELGGLIAATADRVVGRLAGLSDAEYLWEPVENCWSLRPAPDGSWVVDLGPDASPWTPVSPPPVTTIAWRMWHLGASPTPSWPPTSSPSARAFADAWFRRPGRATAAGLSTASTATAAMASHWAAVATTVKGFDDDELMAPIGDAGGPFSDGSILGLVLHVVDELVHHSAEIALLRDLFAAGASTAGDAP